MEKVEERKRRERKRKRTGKQISLCDVHGMLKT
jgi:hypothetical protein